MSNRSAETVQFRLPSGDAITVKLVDLGIRGGVTVEPVSSNANNVHHHAFESNGDWNILIRDRMNQNVAAFVLDKRTGSWSQRSLTDAEKRTR